MIRIPRITPFHQLAHFASTVPSTPYHLGFPLLVSNSFSPYVTLLSMTDDKGNFAYDPPFNWTWDSRGEGQPAFQMRLWCGHTRQWIFRRIENVRR